METNAEKNNNPVYYAIQHTLEYWKHDLVIFKNLDILLGKTQCSITTLSMLTPIKTEIINHAWGQYKEKEICIVYLKNKSLSS